MSIGPQVERATPNRDFRDLFERVEKLERIVAQASGGDGDCCVAVERFESPADIVFADNITNDAGSSSDYLAWALSSYDDYSDVGFAVSADGKTVGMPYVAESVYLVQISVFIPTDPTAGLQADDMRKQWALEVCEGEAADIDSFADMSGTGLVGGRGLNTFGRAAASYDLDANVMGMEFFWRSEGGGPVQGLQTILFQSHPGSDPGLRQSFAGDFNAKMWIARLHVGS